MAGYRQPIGGDVKPHELPTLQPGTMGVLFSESFDVLTDKQVANAYASAMNWPSGWQTWDLHAKLAQQYCDQGKNAGVIAVRAPNNLGAYNVAGKLRAWPDTDASINAWKIFARVGVQGTPPDNVALLASLTDSADYYGGVLISSENLLAPGDGKFFIAGVNHFTVGELSTWTDSDTLDSKSIVGPQQNYVQISLVYDPDTDITTAQASLSADGSGFSAFDQLVGEVDPNAVWTMEGRPKVFGFAGACAATDDDPLPSPIEARLGMNYIALFGATTAQQMGSEGGRIYT